MEIAIALNVVLVAFRGRPVCLALRRRDGGDDPVCSKITDAERDELASRRQATRKGAT